MTNDIYHLDFDLLLYLTKSLVRLSTYHKDIIVNEIVQIRHLLVNTTLNDDIRVRYKTFTLKFLFNISVNFKWSFNVFTSIDTHYHVLRYDGSIFSHYLEFKNTYRKLR